MVTFATFISGNSVFPMHRKPICLTLLFLLFLSSRLFAFSVAEDATGAEDYQGIQRYPDSKIERYHMEPEVDYLVALGNLKKVNRTLSPEYSSRFKGRLTRITYRIPDGHESEKAYRHYFRATDDATLLFECHGRECGSSSHWANQIFGIAQLYGPEGNQHYAVKQINQDGQNLLLVIYAIERGNKRVYVHLDLLEIDQQAAQQLSVNPSTYVTAWRNQGRVILPGLKFNEQDQLLDESKGLLEAVVKAMGKELRMRFWVVGHLNGQFDLELLRERSLIRARSVRDALREKGVSEERLVAQGVGPLAPLNGAKGAEGRIELVRQP